MGLALLPLLGASLHQLVLVFPAVGSEGWRSWWPYAAGFGCYGVIEWLFHKPMWVYVFGHELTHVVSGVLSGAKIHDFKATSRGGEVKLSKSNAFIALSPYVVPSYAVFVLLLYVVIRQWWPSPQLTLSFQFLMGFFIAFHISLTLYAVHRHQPDLKVLGHFLSSVVIILGNALILGVLCVSLFQKTPTLRDYAVNIKGETVAIWKKSIKFAHKTGQKTKDKLELLAQAGSK